MDGGEQVATDSKTVVGVSSTMGSNPILSAIYMDYSWGAVKGAVKQWLFKWLSTGTATS